MVQAPWGKTYVSSWEVESLKRQLACGGLTAAVGVLLDVAVPHPWQKAEVQRQALLQVATVTSMTHFQPMPNPKKHFLRTGKIWYAVSRPEKMMPSQIMEPLHLSSMRSKLICGEDMGR